MSLTFRRGINKITVVPIELHALREIKMYLVTTLVLLPAIVLGEDVEAAPSFTFEAICDFYNTEIDKAEQMLSSFKVAKDNGVDLDEIVVGDCFTSVCIPTLHKMMNLDQTLQARRLSTVAMTSLLRVSCYNLKKMEDLISDVCEKSSSGSSRRKRAAVTAGGMRQQKNNIGGTDEVPCEGDAC